MSWCVGTRRRDRPKPRVLATFHRMVGAEGWERAGFPRDCAPRLRPRRALRAPRSDHGRRRTDGGSRPGQARPPKSPAGRCLRCRVRRRVRRDDSAHARRRQRVETTFADNADIRGTGAGGSFRAGALVAGSVTDIRPAVERGRRRAGRRRSADSTAAVGDADAADRGRACAGPIDFSSRTDDKPADHAEHDDTLITLHR
jgi:hypothetical protein